jgi:cysteine synthase A
MIYEHMSSLIGNTPILHLEKVGGNDIYVKLEMFNPSGSVKDRVALMMIDDLLSSGKLSKGGKAVEGTSGNTGIGLAMVCAEKGIKLTIVMPENMSKERIDLMRAYGAEVILTPKEKGMVGAEELAKEMGEKGYVFLNQFENKSNPKAHMKTTAKEIIRDFPEGLDYFVAGVGTAGTLIGNGMVLKEAYKNIKLIAVEPFESEVLEGKKAGPHKIQGIGANFVPPLYEKGIVDEIMPIKSDDAIKRTHDLAEDGIFLGISSGAAILAAENIARSNEGKGLKILALAPDGGIKYMSMGIYGEK